MAFAGFSLMVAVLSGGAARAETSPRNESAATVISGTGTLIPHKSSGLGPLVEGRIERIHVNVGDRVEAGAPLFETRPESYRLKVEELRASVTMIDAQLKLAQATFGRTNRLSDQGVASNASRDAAITAVQVAAAELELARARLRQAEQDLADTTVRAPFTGTITARYLDEGVFLTNRVPGGTGSLVLQLQKIDILVAIVKVPSRDLPRLAVGNPAVLRIDGVEQPIRARVDVINDMVDPATRTVEIRLGVENLRYSIRPGVFVQAEICSAERAEATAVR